MNLSRPFILRPVATALLMAALLLSGVMAYRLLPVSALPQVDYPTIRVSTFYPGASPEVMASAVTAPLERQFGQIPGLEQMSSTSSGGASVITLRFSLDKSLDVAEQEVQAALMEADQDEGDAGAAPVQDGGDHRQDAQEGGAHESGEEDGVDDDDVDFLHGGDPFGRGEATEGGHHADREGEVHPGHQS